MIREAAESDRDPVLAFCRDTFSWGDYVGRAWDRWMAEGGLLVFDDGGPVGICHGTVSRGRLWLEGLRVSPKHRGRGIASALVGAAEEAGRNRGAASSSMLVESDNAPSLRLASLLGYGVPETWNFFSMVPGPSPHAGVAVGGPADAAACPGHLNSWRWEPAAGIPATPGMTVARSGSGRGESAALISRSAYSGDVMAATLFSGSDDSSLAVLSFLRDRAHAEGFGRIQVITQWEPPHGAPLGRDTACMLLSKALG